MFLEVRILKGFADSPSASADSARDIPIGRAWVYFEYAQRHRPTEETWVLTGIRRAQFVRRGWLCGA